MWHPVYSALLMLYYVDVLLYSTECVVSHIFYSIVIVLYPEEHGISSMLYHGDDVVLLRVGIHTLVYIDASCIVVSQIL